MAITINYTGSVYRIIVPQADLINVSGSLYELDTDALRLSLKAIEADSDGMVFQDTHRHNTEVALAGVIYARVIEILNSTNSSQTDVYEIFFDPDTTYSVRLAGSNNNFFDLQNAILANTVTQVIPQNSAGLIRAPVEDIAAAVWDEPVSNHLVSGTTGDSLANSEFNGKVTINTSTGSSGTTFPIGTESSPVDNLVDALAIAVTRGIDVLHLDTGLTIASGENVSGYTLTSSKHVAIVCDSGCITAFTNFRLVSVSGDLNGFTIIENSTVGVGGITGFHGIMDRGIIRGTIVLSSNSANDAVFLDCFTGAVSGPTIMDLNGDGAKCSFRGLTGAMLFTNKTGSTNPSFIDIYSARIGFDNTITAGAFTVRGIGYIYQDDSTTATFNTQGLMSKETIGVAVWDETLTGGTHNIPSSAGRRLRQLSSGIIFEGVAQGPGTNGNQIVLSNDSASTDGAYDPAAISITEGTGVGQSRLILEYDGASRTATVDRDWKTAPDTSSVFVISSHPGREHVNEGLATGGTINTITLNANADSNDDTYARQLVFIRSGTGQDQVGRVNSYDGTTKVATMEFDWMVIPDTTSGYVMLANHTHTPIEMAGAVWDEAKADHEVEGSFSEHIKRIRNQKV